MEQFLRRRVLTDRRRTEITDEIVSWITGSPCPMSIVSDDGSVKLVRCLEPGYKIPSRMTITALIQRKHGELQNDLVAVLRQVGGIVMTSDYWSSAKNISCGT